MSVIKYRRDLWQLVKAVPGGVAEVGVAEGNFSREMLDWPISLSTLYCVDRWAEMPTQKGDASCPQKWHDENYRRAKEQVVSTRTQVVFLRGESVKVAMRIPARCLRLVYIDADHSYEGVMADIRAWHPKLVQGGVMAFHDYLNPAYGVYQAVLDFAKEKFLELHTIPEDKPEDAGAWFLAHGYADIS